MCTTLFNYPYYLRGMENLFIDMYEDPGIVERLVDVSDTAQHSSGASWHRAWCADFILLGDDYGASSYAAHIAGPVPPVLPAGPLPRSCPQSKTQALSASSTAAEI